MSTPRGIPSVTYVRINKSLQSGWTDVVSDGPNTVTVLETDKPFSRHDVAQVLDKTLLDEDVCENTIGNLAGAGLGVALNPISAFVSDAASSVILLIGSKETKKWQFLKRFFLPFLANELFSNHIMEREDQSLGFYEASVSISAFEIQDEVITDLLRPSSVGLTVSFSGVDGITVQGLQKELVPDEMSLRRVIMGACESRASYTLPPGGSIDTSTAVWEIELRQSEKGTAPTDPLRSFRSRMIVVDVPAVDAMLLDGSAALDKNGPTLHKSLAVFDDVINKLSKASTSHLVPFRASKLTHYLSELLGGNAIVIGIGFVTQGEPAITRKTLKMIQALAQVIHYPIGGKELTEVLQGLLGKYRSMVLELQHELYLTSQRSRFIPDIQSSEIVGDADIKVLKESKSLNSTMNKGERSRGFEENKSVRNRTGSKRNNKYDENLENQNNEERKSTKIKGIKSNNNNSSDENDLKSNEVDLQKIYEKLLIEMDDRSRQEFELILSKKEDEFKMILDHIDFENKKQATVKDQDFKIELREVRHECDVANDDRAKLLEISELLHTKYSTVMRENQALTQDLMLAEEDKDSLIRTIGDLKNPETPNTPHSGDRRRERGKDSENRSGSEYAETMRAEISELKKELMEKNRKRVNSDDEEARIAAKWREREVEFESLQNKLSGREVEFAKERAEWQARGDAKDDEVISLKRCVEVLRAGKGETDLLASQAVQLQREYEVRECDLKAELDRAGEGLRQCEARLSDTTSAAVAADHTAHVKALEDEEQNNLDRRNRRAEEEEEMRTVRKSAEESLEALGFLKDQEVQAAVAVGDGLRRDLQDARADIARISEEAAANALQNTRVIEAEKRRTRQFEVKLRDSERSATRWEGDCDVAQREMMKQGEELKAVRKAYRGKLSSLLSVHEDFSPSRLGSLDLEDTGGGGGGDKGSARENKEKEKEKPRDPLSDLLISYGNSEERMLRSLSKSESQVDQLKSALRSLHDKYRACLDDLGEMQRNEVNFSPVLAEQIILGGEALGSATSLMLESMKEQEDAKMEITQWTEGGPLEDQERSALVLSSYKRSLEKSESQLATSRQEIAILHVQLRNLISGSVTGTRQSLSAAKREGGLDGGIASLQPPSNTDTLGRRTSPLKPGELDGMGLDGKDSERRVLDRQLVQSRNQIQALTEKVEQLTAAAAAVVKKVSAEDAAEAAYSNHDSVFYRKMASEVEARSALLASRNAALEAELKSYQDYMRVTVLQYKNKIKGLRHNSVGAASGGGGGGGETPHSDKPANGSNKNEVHISVNVADIRSDPTQDKQTKFPLIER